MSEPKERDGYVATMSGRRWTWIRLEERGPEFDTVTEAIADTHRHEGRTAARALREAANDSSAPDGIEANAWWDYLHRRADELDPAGDPDRSEPR